MLVFNFENYVLVLLVNFIGKNSGYFLKIIVFFFKYFVNGGGFIGNFIIV